MPVLRVPGGVLDYECGGDPGAAPVLLLHALGSSLAMWEPQWATLAQSLHVVRYSMRGHGASTIEGTAELDLDTIARDACALLDALGLERAHWCGLSLGGMAAMHAAVRYPSRVDRLVLAHAAPALPPPATWAERMTLARTRGMAPLAEGTMQRWFTATFHRESPAEVDRIRQIFVATDPAGYTAACAAIRDADLREHLPRIGAPTLLITGSADAGVPPAAAAAMQAAIPGARLAILEAAHLSNIEASEQFTRAVLAHLALSP